MEVEIIEDILSELADKIGVYGCCKHAEKGADCHETDSCCCRVGFMIEYSDRIYKAIENEEALIEIGTRPKNIFHRK